MCIMYDTLCEPHINMWYIRPYLLLEWWNGIHVRLKIACREVTIVRGTIVEGCRYFELTKNIIQPEQRM